MRRLIAFDCAGDELIGSLDEADGATGWLIVSGGGQTRFGPHRLFERLAARLASEGQPVFRFDRRGVGDSAGEDRGYAESGPDLAAAAGAFRAACPHLREIIGFGLCDGATALALFGREAGVDRLVLANPWVVAPTGGLPPKAAIRARYRDRLTSPLAWRRLLHGEIDLRKAMRGLSRLAQLEDVGLATQVGEALKGWDARIILSEGDATALAFAAALPDLSATRIPTASHSFAGPGDFEALVAAVRAR